MNELLQKVNTIQTTLKAPKGQTNQFGGYKYRSCEDILEAVKPLLNEQSLILTLTDNVELIGDRYYIKATATLTDTETEKSVYCTAYARESESKKGMDASQVTGSCSSYARKYALAGLFLLDDTKDADTMDNTVKAQATEPMITAEQTKQITENMSEERIEKMLEFFKVKSIKDLTLKQASDTIKKMKSSVKGA